METREGVERPPTLWSYAVTVAALWTLLPVAAWWYASRENLPSGLAWRILPAFLLEAALYVAPGFPAVLDRLRRLSPGTQWMLLAASAMLPCAALTLATGGSARALLLVGALAALASRWRLVLPAHPVADIGFLLFMGAVLMSGVFRLAYPRPVIDVPAEVLGHLMWVRIGITAVLLFRPPEGIGFGFWPRAQDWRIGLREFAFLIPVAIPAALWLGFAQLRPARSVAQTSVIAVLTFLAILWVVALSEEFFFRGLLQNWLSRWTGSTVTAIAITSVLFGLVHLPFREFPNWKFAALAALASVFYGRAYQRARSIRAAMVTHALVVTVWRTLFV
jgi:uncharacterized protein